MTAVVSCPAEHDRDKLIEDFFCGKTVSFFIFGGQKQGTECLLFPSSFWRYSAESAATDSASLRKPRWKAPPTDRCRQTRAEVGRRKISGVKEPSTSSKSVRNCSYSLAMVDAEHCVNDHIQRNGLRGVEII